LNSTGKPAVIFVDEFDKLFTSHTDTNNPATSDVQDEFLKTIEGQATVAGEYGKFHSVDTSKYLFVFSGSFAGAEITTLDQLQEKGVRTEFVGRVPLVYHLPKVPLSKLLMILANSTLLPAYADTLKINLDKAKIDLVNLITAEYPSNTIGIRLVNKLIHQYFIDGSPKTKPKKKMEL